jgi:hypothetical protein
MKQAGDCWDIEISGKEFFALKIDSHLNEQKGAIRLSRRDKQQRTRFEFMALF